MVQLFRLAVIPLVNVKVEFLIEIKDVENGLGAIEVIEQFNP
ncbi:hypothetical protein [Fredinandcohnia quinoae]|nr:hypothetical protein [Fredinandcohnia sp. SECRCQ15]